MFKSIVLVALCLVAVALGAPQAGRIVGGRPAADGQFPHQISLRMNGRHSCGGSIINNQWILTAAHCVDGYTNSPQLFTVVAGTNRLSQGGQSYRVQKVIRHPNYDARTTSNDVAVIKLTNQITFSSKVRAIPLSNGPSVSSLVLSGWGTTSYPGSTPENLQYVQLNVYDNANCAAALAGVGTVTSTNICSYSRAGQGACHGDSGGPLIASTGEQVGIVSWGYPCAKGRPDVYARVSSFLGWINQQIQYN